MIQLTQITDDYKQNFSITTEDNYTFTFDIEYKPNQYSWFYSLSYTNTSTNFSFTTNGERIITAPNFLRKYKNILPFGMMCQITDLSDPYFYNDFSNERAILFVLSQNDVDTIETTFFS